MSELVPAQMRGRAAGLAFAGSGATSVAATIVVWASAKVADARQYRIPLIIQVTIPLTLTFLTCLLTESPTWLASKGRASDATIKLMSLRKQNGPMVEEEMQAVTDALATAAESRSTTRFAEILKRRNLTRTFVASSYLPFGQVCGQSLAISYSTVLFVQAGVSNAFAMTILVFALQLLGNLMGPFLADFVGRRYLALCGLSLLVLLDGSAGGLACGGLTTRSSTLGLAALSCIFAFVNAASLQSLYEPLAAP